FVSSIYPRLFKHDETTVSPQVRRILETIGATPRIGRKELADKLIVDLQKPVEAAVSAANDSERAKLSLASDLKWLINEGHVIEFNDGSLDLPRAKAKAKKENAEAAEKEQRVEAGAPPTDELPETEKKPEDVVAAVGSTAEPEKQAAAAANASTTEEPTEIGGR